MLYYCFNCIILKVYGGMDFAVWIVISIIFMLFESNSIWWKYKHKYDRGFCFPEISLNSHLSKYLKIKIVRVYLGCKMASKDVTFYKNLIKSIDRTIEV